MDTKKSHILFRRDTTTNRGKASRAKNCLHTQKLTYREKLERISEREMKMNSCLEIPIEQRSHEGIIGMGWLQGGPREKSIGI